MSNENLPTAPDAEERARVCTELGEKYPLRDRKGYVMAYYVTAPRLAARGPFVTAEEAEAAMTGDGSFFAESVTVGLVFTPWGTIVREETEDAEAAG